MTQNRLSPTPATAEKSCDTGRNEAGSAPTESRPLDRLDLALEGSGPVAIVPEPPASVSTYTERMARLDGCPSCVLNVEPPSAVYDDEPRGFIGNYLCVVCGHAWTTTWRDR